MAEDGWNTRDPERVSLAYTVDGPTIGGSAGVNLSRIGSISVGGHPNCSIKKSGLGLMRCVS
jgi:hypothetical protein